MRHHHAHAPRHTKAPAHTGKQMRNIRHQLLGWVLIACLVCTTVALPLQRTDAFVPAAAPVFAPLYTAGIGMILTALGGEIKRSQTAWQACVKNFSESICRNINSVSATVSALTVGAMVVSDTCKGMTDVIACGKKLWEKLQKFWEKAFSGSKKSGFIQNVQKCFLNPKGCEKNEWDKILGGVKVGKSTWTATVSQKPSNGSGNGGNGKPGGQKPATTASQKPENSQYRGIHSGKGKNLFAQIESRKKELANLAKRSDITPKQMNRIKQELQRINKTRSHLLDLQKKAENNKNRSLVQVNDKEIQYQIELAEGDLDTFAKITDRGMPKRLDIPNENLSYQLLNEAYPDAGMGLSGGLDPLSDSVTAQFGDPSTRVETGKCFGPDIDNNAIVMHLLQSKDAMSKKYKITDLKLVKTAYGLMLQGTLNGKTVYILPCVPAAGYNTFFVGTMAELQALLKSAQTQGKLRYGVGGKVDDVVKKVTKSL